MDRDVRFAVTCGNSGGLKGIHLRGHEATKSVEIPVKVIIHKQQYVTYRQFKKRNMMSLCGSSNLKRFILCY